MALTTCGDCGNQISTDASACPNCGKPLPKNRSTVITLLLAIVVTLVLGAIIIYMVIQKKAEADVATWETIASVDVRNLADSEMLYQLKTGKYGSLNDLINAGLVERSFATEKGGYIYRIQSSPHRI